jgi:hypothetical protein
MRNLQRTLSPSSARSHHSGLIPDSHGVRTVPQTLWRGIKSEGGQMEF